LLTAGVEVKWASTKAQVLQMMAASGVITKATTMAVDTTMRITYVHCRRGKQYKPKQ
jgi:hypothetical protein